MKLLSLALPGFSGLNRGCGKIVLLAGGDVMDEAGGEGNVGWRKPPGPGASGAELIGGGCWCMKSRWFAVGKLADRQGR